MVQLCSCIGVSSDMAPGRDVSKAVLYFCGFDSQRFVRT